MRTHTIYKTILAVFFFIFVTHISAVAAEKSEQAGGDFLAPLLSLFDIIRENHIVRGSIIIVLACIFSILISWFLLRVLNRISQKTNNSLDDRIVAKLRIPLFLSLLMTGVHRGLVTMPIPEHTGTLIGRIFLSIAIILWTMFAIQVASILLARLAQFNQQNSIVQQRTLTLFDNGAKVLILGVALYAFFVTWKINMTAWLTSAGIAGIAIGFAAKDTLSNLFAGVFIIADSPYSPTSLPVFLSLLTRHTRSVTISFSTKAEEARSWL